jgi:hypothetical protein
MHCAAICARSTATLSEPNFGDGAGTQLAMALGMRLAHSLTSLQIRNWKGSDEGGAEVIRSLSAASRLQSLYFTSDVPHTERPVHELVKWLKNNCTLTELKFNCDETKAETSPSSLAALVDAVRSNPHSALTDLNTGYCLSTTEGAAALVSLIELPRIQFLTVSLSDSQAAVPYDFPSPTIRSLELDAVLSHVRASR